MHRWDRPKLKTLRTTARYTQHKAHFRCCPSRELMKNSRPGDYHEDALTKTKIVATVGPACDSPDLLRKMVQASVDIFRLNFAHGAHDNLARVLTSVRQISEELDRHVGILGDLAGPRIRLGELPGGSLQVDQDRRYAFTHEVAPDDPQRLTTTYDGLVEDLEVGDPVLLADGTVALRFVEKDSDRAVCVVEQPGLLRSGQGVNLPGSDLGLPAITEKERGDLAWAVGKSAS
jgi:pyruvate kinase